jgi:hypothetical protein
MDQTTTRLYKRDEGLSRHIGPASLGDQALAKLVQTILTSKHDITLLNVAMCIPYFNNTLTQHLYAVKDDVVKSPAASELLILPARERPSSTGPLIFGLTPETILETLQGPELKHAG